MKFPEPWIYYEENVGQMTSCFLVLSYLEQFGSLDGTSLHLT